MLPFGRLWYGEPNAVSNAIGYAKHRSRSHDAVIRVYDGAGNVIETHEHGAISKSGSAWQFYGLFRTVCGTGLLSSMQSGCRFVPHVVVGLHPTFVLDSGFAILRASITRQVR